MDILKDILGMQVNYKKWDKSDVLPGVLAEAYAFTKAEIEGVTCIIIELRGEFPSLPGLKRQIKLIHGAEELPVVLKVDSMSAFRRKSLIQDRIPFIISEKQIYLPFLGAYLMAQEVKVKAEEKPVEKLMYSTQQLFLWYFYQNKKSVYISEAAKVLPFSAMTLTRATRQLESTEFFSVKKDGVNKVLEASCDRLVLYEGMLNLMRSPVSYRGYVDKVNISDNMVLAGVQVLESEGVLRESATKTYAVLAQDIDKKLLQEELLDYSLQDRIEVWQYDPGLFSMDGCADPISVVLSLESGMDEVTAEKARKRLEEYFV